MKIGELNNKPFLNRLNSGLLLVVALWSVNATLANAQQTEWPLELERLQQMLNENHPITTAIEQENEASRRAIGTADFMDAAEVYYFYDEANIARNDAPIEVWGISQSFRFPTVYLRNRNLLKKQFEGSVISGNRERLALNRAVADSWLNLVYLKHKYKLFKEVESFYAQFLKAEKAKFESGASPKLRMLLAQSELAQISAEKASIGVLINSAEQQLGTLVGSEEAYSVETEILPRFPDVDVNLSDVPLLQAAENARSQADASQSLSKSKWLPDLSVEMFQGTNQALGAEIYQGIRLGVSVPLWFKPKQAAVQSANAVKKASEARLLWTEKQIQSSYLQRKTELERLNALLSAFNTEVNNLNIEAFNMAKNSYESGESSYMEYLQSLEAIRQNELTQLDYLLEYNQTILSIRYLDSTL